MGRRRRVRKRYRRNFPNSRTVCLYDCPICGKPVQVRIDREAEIGYVSCKTCLAQDEIPILGIAYETVDVFCRFVDRVYEARIQALQPAQPAQPIPIPA